MNQDAENEQLEQVEELPIEEVADEEEDESSEITVSIGEDNPPVEDKPAPSWVKELRKSHRELQRKNRDLELKLQTTQTETKPVMLSKKPTLEDADYDAERFEQALASWFDEKRQVDEVQAKVRHDEETQQQAWQNKLDSYGKARAELKVKDYEDAEAFATELFTVTQQGVMLQGAENPALVVYALGKNPKKAKELADIKDPVKFAFAIAKLETTLKVTNKRSAPPPENVVRGTGRTSGTVDSTLERLRDEAARTGNMTKVIQYRAQKRSASK